MGYQVDEPLDNVEVIVVATDAVDAVVAFPENVVAVNTPVDGLYVSGPVTSSTYNCEALPAVVF